MAAPSSSGRERGGTTRRQGVLRCRNVVKYIHSGLSADSFGVLTATTRVRVMCGYSLHTPWDP